MFTPFVFTTLRQKSVSGGILFVSDLPMELNQIYGKGSYKSY